MKYPPDVRIIRVMCAGRVDLSVVFEAFVCGADGVFIGACLRGECHYSGGNIQAENRVNMGARILGHMGLKSQRLVLKMMSSAEGARFVQFVTEFQAHMAELGPIGAGEGLDLRAMRRKLMAAKNAVDGKKLRWVTGKNTEFRSQGNVYGEIFTGHEINRLFEEVLIDECGIQEILLLAQERPCSALELSRATGMSSAGVMRHLIDMKRLGLLDVVGVAGDSALWGARANVPDRAQADFTRRSKAVSSG